MVLADFENLLKETMGLDVASIGSSAIERAVEKRLLACELRETHAYWERVRASEAELQELIEAVVVPETWFFRDREAFAALALTVYEDWLGAHPEDHLRLLSLPSSTGEEPYSMAMALLDAGFPANRFRVDAVDISARALARAGHAVYGKNSFRGNELGFRDRHFEATAHGYRLSDAVRRQVQFQQGNLLAAGFMPGVEGYDVIFCRNVLIYFDRAAQDRALTVLVRLLTPKGVLFVAPSETGLLLGHNFIPTNMPRAFAFRKAGVIPREPKPNAARPVKRSSARRQVVPPVPALYLTHAPPAIASAVTQTHRSIDRAAEPEVGIDEATRLADQGRLVEATACCEEHLRQHGPSANAFHLMGLVRDATGNQPEASDYYRKALYLDPNHHEALIHLALLMEKKGNTAGAQLLRNRARRLEQKSKS